MEAETKTAAHTPGPWIVSRDDDTTLTIVAPWSVDVPVGSDGWGDYRGIHTATITHHAGDGAVPREHAEANARLIAAAPDLLAALESLFALVQGEVPSLLEDDHHWSLVTAAIARARGEP